MKTNKLTPSQQAAAESTARFTIAIAGPGGGKTKTLDARIKWLIETGCNPADIVAITFTTEAADEIQRRLECQECKGFGFIEYETGGVDGDGENDSRHSERYQCECGGRNVALQYVGTLHGFILRLLRRHGLRIGVSGVTVADEETAAEIKAEAMKEARFKGSESEFTAAVRKSVIADTGWTPRTKAELAACGYVIKMKGAGLVDYDLLLLLGLRLVRLMEMAGESLGEHLLVDEVQDSGEDDADIYASLIFSNKFFIGDPDQSIYGFRGGSPAYLLELIAGNPGSTHTLSENFRSRPEIVEAAQNLIANNKLRPSKRMTAVRESAGPCVSAVQVRSEMAEMVLVAQQIASAVSAGTRPEDCAVLVKTNASASAFRACLETYSLSISRNGCDRLPEDWMKLRRLLTFYRFPDDDRNATWYLKNVWIGDHLNIAKIVAAAGNAGVSINEQIGLRPLTPWNAGGDNLINSLARDGVSRETLEIVRDIMAGIDLLEDGAMDALALALAAPRAGRDKSPGVHVGTIHSAKGREWPAVWLPGWNAGFLPRKIENEEERRLAFVAMTRAADRLTITFPEWRAPHQNTIRAEEVKPSQFLAEAGLLGVDCPA